MINVSCLVNWSSFRLKSRSFKTVWILISFVADDGEAWTTGGEEVVRWRELCDNGVERFIEWTTGSDDVDEDDDDDVGSWITDLEFNRASSKTCVACC